MDWFGIFLGFLSVLFIIVSVALMLVILVQRPHGGGLSGAFGAGGGSTQTAFGAKTGDVLTLVTVGAFILFLLTSIGLVLATGHRYQGSYVPIALPPGDFTAVADSDSSVHLTWTDANQTEDSYIVERSTDNVTWTTVATLPADSVEHLDTGLTPATPYRYRVSAHNSRGSSRATPPRPVTTKAAQPQTQADLPPSTPSVTPPAEGESSQTQPAGATPVFTVPHPDTAPATQPEKPPANGPTGGGSGGGGG